MKKYDLESFLRDVETYLKANLNDQINLINAEKNDFAIDTVDAEAYIYQTLNDKVVNYPTTIFYYIENIASEGINSATSEEVSIEVVAIVSDAQDGLMQYKLLRYLRALKDLFNIGFNKVHYSKKLKVESLVPVEFALQNSSSYVHAIGVRLTTVLI